MPGKAAFFVLFCCTNAGAKSQELSGENPTAFASDRGMDFPSFLLYIWRESRSGKEKDLRQKKRTEKERKPDANVTKTALFLSHKGRFPKQKRWEEERGAIDNALTIAPPPPPFHPNVHTDALKRREGRLTMMSPEKEEIKGPHACGRGLLLQTHTYVLYWRQRYRHGWGGGPFYIPRCGFSQMRHRKGKGKKRLPYIW